MKPADILALREKSLQEEDDGSGGRWTFVKGKDRLTSREGLDKAQWWYKKEQKDLKYLKDLRRNKKKFAFTAHTANNVVAYETRTDPLTGAETKDKYELGTLRIPRAPYVKSKFTNTPCWERVLSGPSIAKGNKCKINYVKKGKKWVAEFELCTFHGEAEMHRPVKEVQEAIKHAEEAVEALRMDIYKRAEAIKAEKNWRKKDNFETEEWLVHDLRSAMYMFFINGICSFKEFAIPGDSVQDGRIAWFIDGNHHVNYTQHYPNKEGINFRVWHVVIQALTSLMKIIGVKCFFPINRMIEFFSRLELGHPFAVAMLSEIDDRTTWSTKCMTLAFDSWSEGGPVFVVDTVVHLDKVSSINKYVGKDVASWHDVEIPTDELKREFKMRCEAQVSKTINFDRYIINKAAYNDKLREVLTGTVWDDFKEALADFMYWRAVHPGVPFNFLAYVGSMLFYNRHGKLTFDHEAYSKHIFPQTGGMEEGEINAQPLKYADVVKQKPPAEQKPQHTAAPAQKKNGQKERYVQKHKEFKHEEKETKPPAKTNGKHNQKPQFEKKQEPKKAPVDNKTYTPPPVADKTASTVHTRPVEFLNTEFGKLALSGYNSGWKQSVAGSGWCAFDTIISFLERDYPMVFSGQCLPFKREFVTLYARMSSDYRHTPDFSKEELPESHWMATTQILQTLSALGFNAELYTVAAPPDKGEGAGIVRLKVDVVSSQYKMSRLAAVLFNQRHFEPLNDRHLVGHVVESKRNVVPTDYLLTGGFKCVTAGGFNLSAPVYSMLSTFVALSLESKGSYKYTAIRQKSIFACWSFSAKGLVQVYPYTDIEDDDERRMLTVDHYDKQQSLIYLRARCEQSLKALLTPADHFIVTKVDQEKDKNIVENVSSEDAYTFASLGDSYEIRIAPRIKDTELWTNILTTMFSASRGASDSTLIKVPESSTKEEIRYNTQEEVEALMYKFEEDKRKEMEGIKQEIEDSVSVQTAQLESFQKTIIEQREHLEELRKTMNSESLKAQEEIIKCNQNYADALKQIKDMEIELQVARKVEEKLNQKIVVKEGLFTRFINFLLAIIGYKSTKNTGGQIDDWKQAKVFNKLWMPFRVYYAPPPRTWFQQIRKAVPNPKQMATSVKDLNLITYTKNKASTAVQVVAPAVNKIKEVSKQVQLKVSQGIESGVHDSDVSFDMGFRIKDGAFNLYHGGTTLIGCFKTPITFGMLNGFRLAFSKNGTTGFRLNREIAMEYDHNNKEFNQVINFNERFSIMGRGIDYGIYHHGNVAGKTYILRKTEIKLLTERFNRMFMKKDFTTADFASSFCNIKQPTGGYSMKRTLGCTVLATALNLIGQQHWMNVAVPVGASCVKIPGPITKPFSQKMNTRDVLDTTSSCVVMENYLGQPKLAEIWQEENTPQSFVAINNRASNSAIAPRLPAFAKTRVGPEFRLFSHTFWVRTNPVPVLKFFRDILGYIHILRIVPLPLVVAATALVPFKYGLLSTAISALMPLIDLLKFKLDYTTVTQYHMVSAGLISQLNPTAPCLTASSSALLTAKRSAVQVNVQTWFNNINLSSVDVHTSLLASRLSNCQGDWMTSTTAYALALFDRAASSANAMQRTY